ncbi:MAG: DUF2238 domain-containing protein [Nanoarchaeota archaeon]|nr:DUF2238 domain-containing protein [Nanoarchaeota archaeon]
MRKVSPYQWCLLILFVLVWTWAAINPLHRDGWLLENYLVFIFIPLIILSVHYFRLSDISYSLLTLFMILHVVGSHYTYAEVPFGFVLQAWFDASRNMYDRLVHFSFGLLLAYPIREVFMRVSAAKGFWSLYLPVELTLAFSAVYELIEWGTVVIVDPQAGLAFLGAQGDVWDTQKDMALAGLGALLAMIVVFFIRFCLDKIFLKEMKDSFRMSARPLGEVKLRELWVRRK